MTRIWKMEGGRGILNLQEGMKIRNYVAAAQNV